MASMLPLARGRFKDRFYLAEANVGAMPASRLSKPLMLNSQRLNLMAVNSRMGNRLPSGMKGSYL